MVLEETVNLVDSEGNKIGEMEKQKAHELGKLHEAFSIFIFNNDSKILLQKRAEKKYHSGGLWSNACCSHPEPSDNRCLEDKAKDRLYAEMGFKCDLKLIGAIYYKEHVGNGLIEHEYDYIIAGNYDGMPRCNPSEAQAFRWIDLLELQEEINKDPMKFTQWMRIILKTRMLGKFYTK